MALTDYKRPLAGYAARDYYMGRDDVLNRGRKRPDRDRCSCHIETSGGDCPYCFGFFEALAEKAGVPPEPPTPEQLPAPSPHHTLLSGRHAQTYYFNDGRNNIAIAAVEDSTGEWGAYIGTTPLDCGESNACVWAMNHGIKLPRALANAMFPTISKWRR